MVEVKELAKLVDKTSGGSKRLFDPVEGKNCVRQIEKMELLFRP